MNLFLQLFRGLVVGVLHGFDRLVFRGHLRQLSYAHGMDCYLSANRVLLKDYDRHVQHVTQQVIEGSLAAAQAQGRPVVWVGSGQQDKEALARAIAARDGISSGLVCVLKSVEPCWSFEVHRNRTARRLEIRGKQRKCLHLYHYVQHPRFGWLHVRLQTWFPFAMQVALNGREWLSRQLDVAGLAYERWDNKITAVADFARAQRLLDRQLQTAWPAALEALRRQVHPAHPQVLGRLPVAYYWSVYQSEWASDLVFRSAAALEPWYERWWRHALATYRSVDVLRFLGRPTPAHGGVPGTFHGTVSSNVRTYEEGVRLKHWVNGNSLKLYNCGPVLRIETTLNQVSDIRVYRAKEGEPEGAKSWRVLRRGVADLHRRTQVSQAANERYAEALTVVRQQTTVHEVAAPLCERVCRSGPKAARRERALNPLGDADAALLTAVSRPEFLLHGLRNRDLVPLLYPEATADAAERRRRSARVTRLLRLLRAHGLLQKVPHTHRYLVSAKGRQVIPALLAARNATVASLTASVA